MRSSSRKPSGPPCSRSADIDHGSLDPHADDLRECRRPRPRGRRQPARRHITKEFAVDKDYLDKKTKAEICAFIRKQGFLKDEKARQYWDKKLSVGWGCIESLKKPVSYQFRPQIWRQPGREGPAEILK